MGIDRPRGAGGGLGFGNAHILGPVGDLALEIGEGNLIEIDHPDGADARRRQIEDNRASQPAGPHHQHPRRLEPGLPHTPHLAQHDMARVAFQFFIGKGHGSSS